MAMPMKKLIITIAASLLTTTCNFAAAEDRNLAQERACGNQAALVFDKEWARPMKQEWLNAVWESHYNSKFNRCLILITFMSPATKESPDNYQSGLVIDADTRRNFAEYYGRYPLKENEMPMCVLKDQGFMCRNFDQFKELVITHFGFDR
jgi:hypothetical protein